MSAIAFLAGNYWSSSSTVNSRAVRPLPWALSLHSLSKVLRCPSTIKWVDFLLWGATLLRWTPTWFLMLVHTIISNLNRMLLLISRKSLTRSTTQHGENIYHINCWSWPHFLLCQNETHRSLSVLCWRPTANYDSHLQSERHVIVGRNFGSYVTHETKHFIYFYLGQVAVLLFKSGWCRLALSA